LKDIQKPLSAAREKPEENDMTTRYGEAEIKFEARSSKSETNSNDVNSNVLNKSRAKIIRQLVILLLGSTICLSACAGKSASSKFYVLNPLPLTKLSEAGSATLGVYPVIMPDYLDRPQIVTRVSDNEITFEEFSRWAEPLKETFYTVLVDNLSKLLNSEKIIKTSQNLGIPLTFQVGVEVLQFDGTLGGDVVLIARWGLFEVEGKKSVLIRRSSFKESTASATYEALVAAQSRTVAALSREIAEAIKAKK
jgi:hypothetical protein